MVATFDEFVPDPAVAKEFNVTLMTIYRWDRDPAKKELGWPPPLRTTEAKNGRKFRSRKLIEQFKQNVMARALRVGETGVA